MKNIRLINDNLCKLHLKILWNKKVHSKEIMKWGPECLFEYIFDSEVSL